MEKNKNEINLLTINPNLTKLHLEHLSHLANIKDIEAKLIFIKESIIPYSKRTTGVLFKDLNKLIDEIKNVETDIQNEIEKDKVNEQQYDDKDNDENRPFESLDDIFDRFFTNHLYKKDDVKVKTYPDDEDECSVLSIKGIKNYLKKMISIIENLDNKYMEIRRNFEEIVNNYTNDGSLFIKNYHQVLSKRIINFNKLVIDQINAQLDVFIKLNNMYLFNYKPNILNFIELYRKGLLSKRDINVLNELEIDTINTWLSI